MAKISKSSKKTLSIALIATGSGLTIWGYQKSGGFGSQLSNAFTGSHSDNVMMLYISGVVCLIVGIYFFINK